MTDHDQAVDVLAEAPERGLLAAMDFAWEKGLQSGTLPFSRAVLAGLAERGYLVSKLATASEVLPAGEVADTPTDSLDAAWKACEAALPNKRWRITEVRARYKHWRAVAEGPIREGWTVFVDGPTPIAALHALAAKLSQAGRKEPNRG